jgi:hypothetical protein
VDLAWAGGRATRATLRARAPGTRRLRAPAGQQVAAVVGAGGPLAWREEGGTVAFEVEGGMDYEVTFR